ncbi:prepilin-type N-terminal cleavage/methylation domain-containing protein [Orenia marismortui]|uniref:Prepilin-type N-terminal cleavage/methylation domain-containing protein n=1 Tax=Orenia marismortui TaxID=46469 RepID=A0A4V3GYK3_9FIRM|nr:prepilin-type N-terminal cleavage/methylation domain-containing protein [Orenia marismortui]TDX53031.1 prepilin-type N-terminal cleavage/methylation domain-containing protein [Orenia marismortui]
MSKKAYLNGEGFTLIEVIIAIAIVGIVTTAAYNFLISSNKIFHNEDKKASAQNDLQIVSKFIETQLKYAKQIEVLNNANNIQHDQFSYITLDNTKHKISYFPMNRLNAEVEEEVVNSDKFKGNYDFDLSFKVSQDKPRLLSYTVSINELNLSLSSAITSPNLENDIRYPSSSDREGVVVAYEPLYGIGDSIYDKLGWNKFWTEMVSEVYQDEEDSGASGGFKFESSADGTDLSLNITGGEGLPKGGMIFKEIRDDHFEDIPANIDSYSIEVDAINRDTGKGGYGILLRGFYDTETQKDFGYMFQFDPGAHGFVLRRIKNGDHFNTANIGVNAYRPSSGLTSHDGLYGAEYTPYDIANESFTWDSGERWWRRVSETWSNKWWQRYKTKIKVQTQPGGDLIVRAQLEDKDGNKSEEMWFGDFGEIKLNGTVFKGRKLDWDFFSRSNELPGDFLAIRAWDRSGAAHNTDFYEISLEGAEPGVMDLENNYYDKELKLIFDENLNNLENYKTDEVINKLNEDLIIKDLYGNKHEIFNIEFSYDDRELVIILEDSISSGSIEYYPSEEEITTKEGEQVKVNGILFDNQGNEVNEFNREF